VLRVRGTGLTLPELLETQSIRSQRLPADHTKPFYDHDGPWLGQEGSWLNLGQTGPSLTPLCPIPLLYLARRRLPLRFVHVPTALGRCFEPSSFFGVKQLTAE
jgi:hypothetical protein